MNTLVTGATGFIGSHLAERLRRRGDRVLCLAKDAMNQRYLESLGMEVRIVDLNNGVDWASALRAVDEVYHLAGLTRARRPEEFYTENHRATARFIAMCAAHAGSLRRFVYVSSQTASGPSSDGSPTTEEMPCRPVSDYGTSKLLAEEEVIRWKDRIPVTIVRPCAVYGPRERDFYGIFRMVRLGIQPRIGFAAKYVSTIHVDDLIGGILLAASSPKAVGQTYFIAGETPCTTAEIGDAIAAASSRHPLPLPLPHAVVRIAGGISEAIARITGTQVIFNRQKVRELVCRSWVCSVGKAARELGFATTMGLREGMRATYRWYVENGWL